MKLSVGNKTYALRNYYEYAKILPDKPDTITKALDIFLDVPDSLQKEIVIELSNYINGTVQFSVIKDDGSTVLEIGSFYKLKEVNRQTFTNPDGTQDFMVALKFDYVNLS